MDITTETTVSVTFTEAEGRRVRDLYDGKLRRVTSVTFLWQEPEVGDEEQPFVDATVKGRELVKDGSRDSKGSSYHYSTHGPDARQIILDLAAHLADEGRLPRWVQERVQVAYAIV